MAAIYRALEHLCVLTLCILTTILWNRLIISLLQIRKLGLKGPGYSSRATQLIMGPGLQTKAQAPYLQPQLGISQCTWSSPLMWTAASLENTFQTNGIRLFPFPYLIAADEFWQMFIFNNFTEI